MAWIYKPRIKRRNNQKREERNDVYSSSLWKRLRKAKLREIPICEICELEGKTTLAIDVHHLVSFVNADNEIERDNLAFDYNNLASLCKSCHSRIHNGDLKGCNTIEQIKKRLKELKN